MKKRYWLFLLVVAFFIISLIFVERIVSAEDVLVWQGQYYEGTTFKTGTYEFNFSVYDRPVEGDICYTNTVNITTGVWGQWKTEQTGVVEACDNPSKSYFLEISIDGKIQTPRQRLITFDYIRTKSEYVSVGHENQNILFSLFYNFRKFIIPISSPGLATFHARSFMVGGDSSLDDNDIVRCSSQGFLNIDCDTEGTGADLGVNDDLEVLGSTFVGENLNVEGNLNINGEINIVNNPVTPGTCSVKTGNFWAEKTGNIDAGRQDAGIEYSYGDGNTQGNGITQPCNGKVVYMTVQAETAANGDGQIGIVINGADNSDCSISTPSIDGTSVSSSCNLSFNAGDSLTPRTTISPTGQNSGYVVSWWVVYD